MNVVTENMPIFVQIAEGIKDAILSGELKEGEKTPSTTYISSNYDVNIATVNKGFNLLVSENILYKKRGIGMFVAEGAVERLIKERRAVFKEHYIIGALEEARRLRYTAQDIQAMVEEVYHPDENATDAAGQDHDDTP